MSHCEWWCGKPGMKLDAVFFNLIPRVNRCGEIGSTVCVGIRSLSIGWESPEHPFCSTLKDAQHKLWKDGERRFAGVPSSLLLFSGTLSLYYNLPVSLSLNPPFSFYFYCNPSLLSFVMTLKAESSSLYSFLLTKLGSDRPFLSFPFCHLKYSMSLRPY